MHTLSALEVKRRGVAALEEALEQGPVHIIKNNRPACVVISEEDYAAILKQQKLQTASLWELLDNRPWTGKRNKKDIDKQMHHERDHWDK
jgi:PHD/YefM family antitoxin component YafN of YafNO toxin-antitoxin module